MANLTAHQLSEKYRIPLVTIKSWEASSGGALTEKGAYRLIDAMRKEGIECIPSWLLFGEGPSPRYVKMKSDLDIALISAGDYDHLFKEEIDLFYNTYKDAIVLTLPDDAMEPFYSKDNTVGGIWQYDKKLRKLSQHPCIIEDNNQHLLCRTVTPGSKKGLYNCYALNLKSKSKPLLTEDVHLKRAAPILRVWHDISPYISPQ